MELSENDQKLIDEVVEKMAKESDKFFNYFGLTGEEREYARKEAQEFIKDFSEANMGRGFFDSPLGRKAFMVGWFRGRNTFRPSTTIDLTSEPERINKVGLK
jgi:hypothetical protein